MNLVRRLRVKAERHRNTKDTKYEDDEIEEGTLYAVLEAAADTIARHNSERRDEDAQIARLTAALLELFAEDNASAHFIDQNYDLLVSIIPEDEYERYEHFLTARAERTAILKETLANVNPGDQGQLDDDVPF